jgi:hypothetical protein
VFWESLVARACDRHAARVHGYAWLPNEALLLLQRFAVPLRNILPSLLGQYSRHLHRTGHVVAGESPYIGRCESMEVTPELLPYALRHLYAQPVRAGLCMDPLAYPFNSAALHFATSVPLWFAREEFLTLARKRGHRSHAGIVAFPTRPESRRHSELFAGVSARNPRVAGEQADIEQSMLSAAQALPSPRIEQIAAAVAILLRRVAKPTSVLAAAPTTWYATRAGAATLRRMGEWLERAPTTLRADIESHRRTDGPLFEHDLHQLLALTR